MKRVMFNIQKGGGFHNGIHEWHESCDVAGDTCGKCIDITPAIEEAKAEGAREERERIRTWARENDYFFSAGQLLGVYERASSAPAAEPKSLKPLEPMGTPACADGWMIRDAMNETRERVNALSAQIKGE